MRLLLDTQVYLWFLADSPRLSKAAKLEIQRADEVLVSAASIWEAAIKAGLGKLDVDAEKLAAGIEASGFAEMPIRAGHGLVAAALPPHHRDPFDRMLIWQAISNNYTLISADGNVKKYTPVGLKIIS